MEKASDYPYVGLKKVYTCEYNAEKVVYKPTSYFMVTENSPSEMVSAL